MRHFSLGELYQTFRRKKQINALTQEANQLVRCLTTLDLTAMGIGSTLGVGIYLLAGEVAIDYAGPAVILSFAIAAFASILAGLCYAEFGARVPKAGSAYIYSYVTMGEFIAFLIGWTLILEYMIGSASVVKALSVYIDELTNKTISEALTQIVPIHMEHLSPYVDLFAFGITIVFSVALAFGVKESTMVNNVFTFVNLAVVIFVIISGAFHVNINNWKLPAQPCPPDHKCGTGGFMPFGVTGIIRGAATCFYGFIGFDCIATACEEAKNPKKSIPIAIVGSLFVVFLAYFGLSTILTLGLPYYNQNKSGPIPHYFRTVGWEWATYLVFVGAICALSTSLMGSMFPLPRVMYSMASDGVIFKWMGRVHSRFQTPFIGTLSAGLFTGILAAILDLHALIEMMSIGTLLSYSVVAACVLILRFEEGEAYEKRKDKCKLPKGDMIRQLLNLNKLKYSTKQTAQLVTVLILLYGILCVAFTATITAHKDAISELNLFCIVPLCILFLGLVSILIFIHLQPKSEKKLQFSVPLVPFLPGLSILINIYLMTTLEWPTWIRFTVWMSVGFLIYFFYGIRNSGLREKKSETEDSALPDSTALDR